MFASAQRLSLGPAMDIVLAAKDLLPVVKGVLEAPNELAGHLKGDYAVELVNKVQEVQAILAFLDDAVPHEPKELEKMLRNAKTALEKAKTPSYLQSLLGKKPDFTPQVEEMDQGIQQLKAAVRTCLGVEVGDDRDLMTVDGLVKLARKASGDLHSRYFRAAAEKEPGNLDIWYEWGFKLSASEEKKDWEEAIAIFKEALKCNPDHPETLH